MHVQIFWLSLGANGVIFLFFFFGIMMCEWSVFCQVPCCDHDKQRLKMSIYKHIYVWSWTEVAGVDPHDLNKPQNRKQF